MSKKISQLTAITAIQEDDLLAIVEGSETKKADFLKPESLNEQTNKRSPSTYQ